MTNEYVKKLKDKELIKEFKELHSMIYQTECFSTIDLILFDVLSKELDKRGYSIKEIYKKPVIFKK